MDRVGIGSGRLGALGGRQCDRVAVCGHRHHRVGVAAPGEDRVLDAAFRGSAGGVHAVEGALQLPEQRDERVFSVVVCNPTFSSSTDS